MKVQHTLYKDTHKWDTTIPYMPWTPCPKFLTPSTSSSTHGLEGGPPGKHSLIWRMIHPIGHFVNPPIPKLGKFHRVFEHMFSLARWFWCTWLGDSFIDLIYLSWYVWLEVLGGCIHCLCRTLRGGQFWRNKPSLGFLRAWSLRDWYHGSHIGWWW
jgi:hypothetical protein